MAWPKPSYSRSEVKRAGEILACSNPSGTDADWAHEVLTNWRGQHGYPINTFQSTLRKKLKRIDPTALVAQRLKRAPSIIKKLRLIPNMSLARMQDIGGLRAVVQNIDQLETLIADYKYSEFSHLVVREDNYIECPKSTGYRSYHLIFRYEHKRANFTEYNKLNIELQFRTRIQHAWATAVETMGTFLGQALKSSEGPAEILKFFKLCGSAFAYLEDQPRVPGLEGLDKSTTFDLTIDTADLLGIADKLRAYRTVTQTTPTNYQNAAYYLVTLNRHEQTVEVEPFRRDNLKGANIRYSEVEKLASQGEPLDVVLVSAGSVESLRRAYPNFFLDTEDFLRQLNNIRAQTSFWNDDYI